MDNRRIFLLAGFVFVAFLIYQAWMQDYGPKPAPEAAAPAATSAVAPTPAATSGAGGATATSPAVVSAPIVLPKGREIHVHTDVLDLVIDTAGGDIRSAQLLKYPQELKDPSVHVRVLDDQDASLLVLQSGLQAAPGMPAPGADAAYTATQSDYTLADGSDTLKVTLTWQDGRGLSVDKTYTLNRASYVIGVDYTVHNNGSSPWQGGAWLQWQNRYTAPHTSMFSSTRYDYQKAAFYGADGYQEQEFTALADKPVNATVNGGWIAVVDHYFLAAIIPADAQGNQYYSRSLGDSRYVTGSLMPQKSVAPGASASFDGRLFVGPKLQTLLASVTKGLELTVDYGKLTIIAQPIFWVLEHIEKLVGNWGWSILILTVLFKALTYKLNEISGRSMAKMRLVQPRIKALQERYAGDRQRLSQAMMELYKKEKINPASGCFPILIQIPIFFSLYYVLVYSAELRQTPWTLWIHDLSAPDPWYVLPLLYGVAMFIQQQLQQQPTDKTQAMMMKFMPVALIFLYMVLPAGLVLYYFANSIISIAQQRYINNLIERESKPKNS
ncbi:MAG: membrane protein insertase YidC [Gammaproteobacteria bacterium]